MHYRTLGKTGLRVSKLSMGASALGGVFNDIDEREAVAAVHAALECGINYFDVAPAYGATRSESVLGRALKGISRESYFLSTKVGKYTSPDGYGRDTLDYSAERIRTSLEESSLRLGTGYFDIVHLHDIEYQGRLYTERAIGEGLSTLHALKSEGRIGNVGFGIYPLDLWQRLLTSVDFDVGLVHNHYCLNDTSLTDLLPLAEMRGVGIINASPFASGLLTERGPASWHPAGAADRAIFKSAAEYCAQQGSSISKLAFQFSSQNSEIDTTLFSSANPSSVRRNVVWSEEPIDRSLLVSVQEILNPVMNKQWSY